MTKAVNISFTFKCESSKALKGDFLDFYDIQHCFICRPSDSTVSEDAGIEPRTVANTALAVSKAKPHAVFYRLPSLFRFEESVTATTNAPSPPTTQRPPFIVTTMLDEDSFHPTTPSSLVFGTTGNSFQNRFPSFTAVPQSGAGDSFLTRQFPAFPAVVNLADNEVDSEISARKLFIAS
jgi:hypothetical protein